MGRTMSVPGHPNSLIFHSTMEAHFPTHSIVLNQLILHYISNIILELIIKLP